MRTDPVQTDPISITVGAMAPGDSYDLDGTWVKAQPTGDIATAPTGKSFFFRTTDGAQRVSDDATTVHNYARKCVGV